MIKSILDALFPRRCAFCGDFMEEDGEICSCCLETLPRLEQVLCEQNMGAVERLYCALSYRGQAPQGIYNLKFKGKSHLHRVFAELMVQEMGKELAEETVDFVTSVPMHRSRQRKRGYNQAELLAKELAQLLAVPYRGCLKKTRLTSEQHRLGARERQVRNWLGEMGW